jgi:hypothetical protein
VVKKAKRPTKSRSTSRRKKTKKKDKGGKVTKTAIKRSQSSESVIKEVKKEKKPKLRSVVIKKYTPSSASSTESSTDFRESCDESRAEMSDSSYDF